MVVISNLAKKTIEDMIAAGKRINGRTIDEFRTPTITTGLVECADGSAMVDLGKTKVVVGIKAEVKEPYPDKPAAGSMSTMAELSPMASSDFESGPPRPPAIEVSRVADRVIRESGVVDFEALCIKEGEVVWNLAFDIYVLDMDGNLIDACVTGIMAALITGKMPTYNEEDKTVDYTKPSGPFPMNDKPASVTFAKIGKHIVVDPCSKEEEVLDARLTIGITESGDICAMQKGGDGSFTKEEVEELLPKAVEHAKRIRELYP